MISRRVMIVDDNVEAAELLAELLQILGHTTLVAHSGYEALAAVGSFQPELAFLDIGMPGMSGFDLAQALHGLPDFQALSLVAVTGWNDAATINTARRVGFLAHLTKPAGAEQIAAAVELYG